MIFSFWHDYCLVVFDDFSQSLQNPGGFIFIQKAHYCEPFFCFIKKLLFKRRPCPSGCFSKQGKPNITSKV